MGTAVWEFMWCLDKVTKVDNQGMGWVLGGKPVKLDELGLGTSEDTVSRNLNKLHDEGYIKLIRTPYGLSIRVFKAKKRFYKNAVSDDEKRSGTNVESLRKNAVSLRKNVESNKTVTVDSTVDSSIKTEQSSDEKEIAQIIFLFQEVNPSYKKLYGSPPQRKAVKRLLETQSLEQLSKVVTSLKQSNKMQFFPVITTPVQLEDNIGKLIAQWGKYKNNSQALIL